MRPLIAIVGRPNVGKSTLLNRLTGRPVALVDDTPGVTRDRIFVDARLNDREVILVDTGGLDLDPDDELGRATVEQARAAIGEADLVLFVCDAKDGLHPVDSTIANLLRKSQKATLCLVNKSDPGAVSREQWDFHRLGLDFLPISASHGTGLTEVADLVASRLPDRPALAQERYADVHLSVCLLGRPNVGKSSLINRLAGAPRQLVSEIPGTTRDAVDISIDRGEGKCLLVDTPGVRRKRSITRKLEQMSVMAAIRSLERAQVAIVVLDGTESFADQDARLLRLVHERGRGLLVAVNKVDLLDGKQRERYLKDLAHGMRFVSYAPVVSCSAKTGSGVDNLLPEAERVLKSNQTRISTADLNKFVAQASARLQPAMVRGKRARIYYITQPTVCPPTFIAWVNDPTRVPRNYQRYLEGSLRKVYPFPGAPLRWKFKKRAGDRRKPRNKK